MVTRFFQLADKEKSVDFFMRKRAKEACAATGRCALYLVRSSAACSCGFSGPRFYYQLASRSGVALILWMARSAPSYSSSWLMRRPVVNFSAP